MNWGKGLTIAMVAFMGFIITMVVIMISADVELESEDYYKKDLAYNGEMEAISRVNEMDQPIELTKGDTSFVVKVPTNEFISDVSIFFSRPNDESQDFVVEIGERRLEKISMDRFNPGVYNIEVRFFAKGKSCLQKDRIYV
ncbi:MAG: FixH family protein [Crocinitomicaceae bacterium]|nr:FixH family protein [Crocinitomicaceae bacterium]